MPTTSTCSNQFLIFCFEIIKTTDIITFLIGISTLIIAYLTFNFQKESQKITKSNQETSNMLYIDQAISQARLEFDDLCLAKATNTTMDEYSYEILFNGKLENIANSYNIACSFYLKELINVEIFKAIRKNEIIDLVNSGKLDKIIKDKDRTNHLDLWKVYTEFKN